MVKINYKCVGQKILVPITYNALLHACMYGVTRNKFAALSASASTRLSALTAASMQPFQVARPACCLAAGTRRAVSRSIACFFSSSSSINIVSSRQFTLRAHAAARDWFSVTISGFPMRRLCCGGAGWVQPLKSIQPRAAQSIHQSMQPLCCVIPASFCAHYDFTQCPNIFVCAARMDFPIRRHAIRSLCNNTAGWVMRERPLLFVLLAGMKALITDIKTALRSAESNCALRRRIKEWKAIFHLFLRRPEGKIIVQCKLQKNISFSLDFEIYHSLCNQSHKINTNL